MQDIDAKLQKLSRKKGLDGASTFMKTLARDHEFVSALETDVGQAVLTLLSKQAEGCMQAIVDMPPRSCKDCKLLSKKMELNAVNAIILKVSSKIAEYSKRSAEFNNL
jgi:hypothetical protein